MWIERMIDEHRRKGIPRICRTRALEYPLHAGRSEKVPTVLVFACSIPAYSSQHTPQTTTHKGIVKYWVGNESPHSP